MREMKPNWLQLAKLNGIFTNNEAKISDQYDEIIIKF